MTRQPVAILAALALSGAADTRAQPIGTVESAIINGAPCDADVETTTVAILVEATLKLPWGGMKQQLKTPVCTGTLIAPDVVLTAGHCVDSAALSGGFGTVEDAKYSVTFEPDLTALAERRSTSFPADAVAASSWVKHPEFTLEVEQQNVNGLINFRDVAVIFLATALERRPEVVVAKGEAAQIVQGAPVQIVGWGLSQVVSGGPFAQPPRGSSGRKVCGDSTINELGEFEMQIGGDRSTTRKCHGDSGGPTFLTIDASGPFTRRVVGITSHAYNAQEDCNIGGVDTRVDAWWDWIDGEMRAACDAGTRQWCKVPGIIPVAYFESHPDWDVLGEDPPPDAGTPVAGGPDGGALEGSGGDEPGAKDDGCAQAGAAAAAVLGLARLARRRRA